MSLICHGQNLCRLPNGTLADEVSEDKYASKYLHARTRARTYTHTQTHTPPHLLVTLAV